MENITVEQVSENELRIIFPCGVNYTSQKPRGISNEAKNIKVEKLNNKELKIILPEGLQITAESMSIEELYHGLTDALVDIPRRRDTIVIGLGL